MTWFSNTVYQKSEDNLQRRALRVLGIESARLVWYSGNSLSNRRGSLMVYDFRTDAHEAWYVALSYGPPWRVERRRGVSARQIQAYAEVGKEVLAASRSRLLSPQFVGHMTPNCGKA